MEYKIVSQKSGIFFPNIDKAAAELARKVSQEIALGWEPQGGVAMTRSEGACLIQAMIKRR